MGMMCSFGNLSATAALLFQFFLGKLCYATHPAQNLAGADKDAVQTTLADAVQRGLHWTSASQRLVAVHRLSSACPGRNKLAPHVN